MSGARRNEFANPDVPVTDETNTFKKAYQTVGKPPVTDNINDQYYRDPPHVNNSEVPTTNRKSRGAKEGAREETDPKQEGVLGDEASSKLQKSTMLEQMTNESSVHPNNPAQ
ncbi:hypothetical protein K474DRAFT_1602111 [Panus rudis PR-1116 ss-1]|nr:hypothetical protein K474DRAFT_1602111 [Panus rudis PR-1116 ss-1]